MSIKYTTYKNINKQKWDECISNSTNHFVYAEAWYLDIVCSEKWDALILNDYEAVMPLPLKSKMSLRYVQQPIWTQQLGIFSTRKTTPQLINSFLQAIPQKMAMVSLNLNEHNFIENQILEPKTNLVLELNKSFEALQTNFSTNTKRNSNKAYKTDLTASFESKDIHGFINFLKKNIPKPVSEFHYSSLEKLIIESLKQQKGFIALVKYKNEIVASSFILKSNNRLIYRTGTSNQQGKDLKAMFLLVNEIIKQYDNSNYLLDFEGSELDGVARFYKGFGTENIPYYYYKKYNNTILQIIKR